jgi:hypothetical protein
MLDLLQQKNKNLFIEHFTKSLGEKYTVDCIWGFPSLQLIIASKDQPINNTWRVTIDVTTKAFALETKSFKLKDEVEVAEWSGIDSATIGFLINESVKVSNQIFNVEETAKSE